MHTLGPCKIWAAARRRLSCSLLSSCRGVLGTSIVLSVCTAAPESLPVSRLEFFRDFRTLLSAPRTQELNTRYYEPLSAVLPSLADIEAGPPVKKLLFMTDPSVVDGKLKPHWRVRSSHRCRESLRTCCCCFPAGLPSHWLPSAALGIASPDHAMPARTAAAECTTLG